MNIDARPWCFLSRSAIRPGIPKSAVLLLPTALLAVLVTIFSALFPSAARAARPNVVVILADDLGHSDLGCYGGEIDTPNLDKLAADGLRFTQGYSTARCWPSRGTILTGYYAQSIRRDALPGGKGGGSGIRPAWARLLPEMLATAGYRCYHSGKWHIDGDPLQQGFHRSLDVTGKGQSNFFDSSGVTEDGKPVGSIDNFYVTTAVGDHALKCLKEHQATSADRPFFHYVAFTSPHFPLQAPQEVIAKYRRRYAAGWNVVQQARYDRIFRMGLITSPLAPMEPAVGPPYDFPDAIRQLGPGEVNRPLPWDQLGPDQREFQIAKMAVHAAMVDCMDQQIGRILQQLRAMKAFENTWIMFASDNGASAEIMVRGEGHDPQAPPGSRKTFLCLGPGWSSCANTPFRRHKTWVHEGGISSPWIIHWPAGITDKGQLRHQMVHLVDVTPTVLDLAGVEAPRQVQGKPVPPMQGRSFVSAFASPDATVHPDLWWCHEGNRAVRVGQWKLVSAKDTPWELYDLAADRCETKNLAADQPDKVAELEAAWNRTADQCRTLASSDGLQDAGGTGAKKRQQRKAKVPAPATGPAQP
ncbi:MAG: arylsulfatase [Thermoguttaceae bacterium]